MDIAESREQNMRYIFFTRFGKLDGIATKADIVTLMNSHIPHVGALADNQQRPEDSPEVVFDAR